MASASRGLSRRELLQTLGLTPLVCLTLARTSRATEYGSASEVFDAMERLAAEVRARLGAVAKRLPSARSFVSSALADHDRHRADRERLRRRLGLPRGVSSTPDVSDSSLDRLRSAQQALVFAHAEGLPALGESVAVASTARNMVDLARHLTVIDLWIEMESAHE